MRSRPIFQHYLYADCLPYCDLQSKLFDAHAYEADRNWTGNRIIRNTCSYTSKPHMNLLVFIAILPQIRIKLHSFDLLIEERNVVKLCTLIQIAISLLFSSFFVLYVLCQYDNPSRGGCSRAAQ